ncbi:MAG: hypothetical protein ACXVQJ_00740 [Actinomycetota bacterium]
MSEEPVPDTRPLGSGPRSAAFRVIAFLFGAAALGGLFGIGLVIGWFDTHEGGIHRVHDIGFGVLYGAIVAAAFFALMVRPAGRPSIFLQVVAVAIAVGLAAVVSADLLYLIVAGALAAAGAILLALLAARDEVLHPVTDPSRPLAAFVLVVALPLVWFGLTAAGLQRNGPASDPHVSMSHWTTMASMAFGLVLVGLLASLRIRGWRFTAWCAGLGAAIYGVASIVFAHFPTSGVRYAGSEGIAWGVIALVGGLAFIGLAEREARRSAS